MTLRIIEQKDDDGNVIPKYKEDLEKLGVTLKDTNGNLLSTYKIVEQLSKVWSGISADKQLDILNKLGGKRQVNILGAMITNFKEAEKVLADAQNSEGSAMEEQSKYAESLQFKINNIKEQLVGIYQKFISSNDLKDILSFGSSLISILDGITSKLGGVGTALSVVMLTSDKVKTALHGKFDTKTQLYEGGGFVNNVSNSYLSKYNAERSNTQKELTAMKGLRTELESLNMPTEALSSKISGLSSHLHTLNLKQKAVKVSTFALQSAMSIGYSLAISLVLQGIMKLIHRTEELKQKNKELVDSFNINSRNNADMLGYLKSEGEEYDKLRTKTHLTTEEQKKFVEIKEKIAQSFPDLVQGYNDETGEIELQIKSTKELIELLREKQSIENNKLIDNGDDKLEEIRSVLVKNEDVKKEIDSKIANLTHGTLEERSKGLDSAFRNDLDSLQYKKELAIKTGDTERAKKLEQTIKNINNEVKELQKTSSDLTKEQNVKALEILPHAKAVVNELKGLDNVTKNVAQAVSKASIKPSELINLKDNDFSKIKDNINKKVGEAVQDKHLQDIKILMKVEQPDEKQIKDYLDKLTDYANKYELDPIELSKTLPLKVDGKEMNKVVNDYLQKLNVELAQAKDEVSKNQINAKIESVNKFKVDIKVNGTEELQKAQIEAENLAQTLKTLQDAYASSMSEVEFYKKALAEMNSETGMSADTMQTIATKYSDLAPYLNNTALLYEKLKEKMKESEVQAQNSYDEMLWSDSNFASEVYKNTKWLSEMKSKWYNMDLTNWKTLGKGKLEIEQEIIKQVAGMWAQYYDAQGNLMESTFLANESSDPNLYKYNNPRAREEAQELLKKPQSMSAEIKRQFKELAKDLKNITPDINFGALDKKLGKSGSGEKSNVTTDGTKKSIYDAMLKDIENNIEKQNNKISILNANIGNLEGLNKRSEALKEQNKLIDEEIKKRDIISKAEGNTKNLTNKITKEMKSKFNINIDKMSETQIAEWYNKNFGGDRNFGVSNNANKAKKDSYEKNKKLVDEYLNDYKKLSDAQDKYTKDTLNSIATIHSAKEKYYSMYSQALDEERKFYTNDTAKYQHERDVQNIQLREDDTKDYDKMIKSQGGLAGGYVNEVKYISNILDGLKKKQKEFTQDSDDWIGLNKEIERHNGLLKEAEKNMLSQISALNQLKKEHHEYLQTLRDKEFESINKNTDNLDELSKQNELSPKSDKYLINKSYIQQVAKMNEEENYKLLQKQRNEITEMMNGVEKNSVEWVVMNKQVEEYNEKLEDSNYKLKEMSKSILETQMQKQYNEYEKYVFGGSSQADLEKQLKDEREAFNNKKKMQEKYLSGLEKDYSLDLLKKDIYETNDATLISTYETMQNAYSINKNDYETLKKKLDIKQLELKLQNLQNEKTVRVMKQLEDGSFDFSYNVDQEEVDKVQNDLKKAQMDLVKWQKDLQLEQEEEYFNQREKALQSQIAYMEALKQIQNNALNGQYKTQEEFNNALKDLNSKLCTEYIGDWSFVLKTQIDNKGQITTLITEMETSYGTFTESMKGLTTDLTTHIVEQSNIIQGTIANMISAFQQMLQVQGAVNTTSTNVAKTTATQTKVSSAPKARFDTGGYTGVWGSSSIPKLAWLDSGEYVLNNKDTSKMFDIDKLLANTKNMNLLSNAIDKISSIFPNMKFDNMTTQPSVVNEYISFSGDIKCPNVTNEDGVENLLTDIKGYAQQILGKKK